MKLCKGQGNVQVQLSCAETWTGWMENNDGKEKGKKGAGHQAPLSLSRTIPICCTSGLLCKSSLGKMSLLLEGKKVEEEKE